MVWAGSPRIRTASGRVNRFWIGMESKRISLVTEETDSVDVLSWIPAVDIGWQFRKVMLQIKKNMVFILNKVWA